jgi:hypothetical protein
MVNFNDKFYEFWIELLCLRSLQCNKYYQLIAGPNYRRSRVLFQELSAAIGFGSTVPSCSGIHKLLLHLEEPCRSLCCISANDQRAIPGKPLYTCLLQYEQILGYHPQKTAQNLFISAMQFTRGRKLSELRHLHFTHSRMGVQIICIN